MVQGNNGHELGLGRMQGGPQTNQLLIHLCFVVYVAPVQHYKQVA